MSGFLAQGGEARGQTKPDGLQDAAARTAPADRAALDRDLSGNLMFLRTGAAPFVGGNKIEVIKNASETFPAWLQALGSARELICIEMYIFDMSPYALAFRDVLLERLKAGVEVYLVYDWLGSLGAKIRGFFKPLIKAGARARPYNPSRLTSGWSMVCRDHRKTIVVDQKLAFVSGLCVSSRWEGNDKGGREKGDEWRDTGLLLRGPVTAQVFIAFWQSWIGSGGSIPEHIDFKAPPQEGGEVARAVASARDFPNMMRLDLGAIASAKKRVWITDAYFMPNALYLQSLLNAARGGADVRVLVPRSSDIRWIARVSRTQYRALLEAGARVFEWNGSMIHAKSAVIDDAWCRVGSTNLNYSSWFANSELDVVCLGETCERLAQDYLEDLKNAREIALSAVEQEALEAQTRAELDALSKLNGQKLSRFFVSMMPAKNKGAAKIKAKARRIVDLGEAEVSGSPEAKREAKRSVRSQRNLRFARFGLRLAKAAGDVFKGRIDEVDESEYFSFFGIFLSLTALCLFVFFFPRAVSIVILLLLAPTALGSFERFLKIAWVVRKKSIRRSLAEAGRAAPAAAGGAPSAPLPAGPEQGTETEENAGSEKAGSKKGERSAGESLGEPKSEPGAEDPGEGRAKSPGQGSGSDDRAPRA